MSRTVLPSFFQIRLNRLSLWLLTEVPFTYLLCCITYCKRFPVLFSAFRPLGCCFRCIPIRFSISSYISSWWFYGDIVLTKFDGLRLVSFFYYLILPASIAGTCNCCRTLKVYTCLVLMHNCLPFVFGSVSKNKNTTEPKNLLTLRYLYGVVSIILLVTAQIDPAFAWQGSS